MSSDGAGREGSESRVVVVVVGVVGLVERRRVVSGEDEGLESCLSWWDTTRKSRWRESRYCL